MPVMRRVKQADPDPIPTFTIDAPDKIKSSVISPVTTLPTIITPLYPLSLNFTTRLFTGGMYPFAASIHIETPELSFIASFAISMSLSRKPIEMKILDLCSASTVDKNSLICS
jgi:hypothetical protein